MKYHTIFRGVYTYVVKQLLNGWKLKAPTQIVLMLCRVGRGMYIWGRIHTILLMFYLLRLSGGYTDIHHIILNIFKYVQHIL